MTREKCKELLPAITHFVNGGNLWSYVDKKWIKQKSVFTDRTYKKVFRYWV